MTISAPVSLLSLLLICTTSVAGITLRGVKDHAQPQGLSSGRPSFQAWYEGYHTGPGIWKWSHILVAYERHLGPFAGYPINIVQAGIQSGGSLRMWRDVLGAKCHVRGIDPNRACEKFADTSTNITIGNPGNATLWRSFFEGNVSSADVVVGDSGRDPSSMVVTIAESFPHLSPGGVIAIEDIYGEGYEHSLFAPVANLLASSQELAAVHVYPFLFIVQKAGQATLPRTDISFVGAYVTVSDFEQMWAHVAQSSGGQVILENPGWGSFQSAQGMINFLRLFGMLHDSKWVEEPAGCESSLGAACKTTVQPGPMQARITGVHIYPTRLVVEVARGPVMLSAVRKGSEWI